MSIQQERPVRLLPDDVINKIAAGEVVERPASVLKELIENSLDAGATRIDVEVVAGGRRLIRVADNGTGMVHDNALLAIERHATSKIRDVNDIENISTLGFRGEALAAMAAVSRFCLKTRTRSNPGGTEINVVGGRLQDVREIGCPPGTCVEVRNLFFNVPARRKFQRSDQTELAHLRHVFMTHALGHPSVGMSLTVDGRQVHVLAEGDSVEERLRVLFKVGSEVVLKPVRLSVGNLDISGYVGLPESSRSDRSEQFTFVNRRPAAAALLQAAIREAYHSLVPRDRHPMVFLFITLDPGEVDVNVHPTKKEVRFRNPGHVRDSVIAAIRGALSISALPGKLSATRPALVSATLAGFEAPRPAHVQYPGPAAGAPAVPRPQEIPGLAVGAPAQAEPEAATAGRSSPWPWHRVLGQVGGLYVVMETADGLVLMDPHAAHERVLFERYTNQIRSGQLKSQGLLMAETVELTPRDAMRVRGALDLLKRMGFGLAEFGGDTFMVDAMPACLPATSAKAVLIEIAACLAELGERRAEARMAEERIVRAACKAAVKANQALDPKQIEELVRLLGLAEMPYTCPHGRPTVISLTFKELNRRFGRGA